MCKFTISLALAGLLFFGATGNTVLAQASGPASGNAARLPMAGPRGHRMQSNDPANQLARMTARLNLTVDQQAQMKPVLESRNQQCQALLTDTALTLQDRTTRMTAIHEQTYSAIQAILNDQQKQKWAPMQQKSSNMPGCMQRRMGRRGLGGPPAP